jgi:hypothetical protein
LLSEINPYPIESFIKKQATMKILKTNKYVIMGAMLLVTALLFVFGRHAEAQGLLTANAAVVTLSDAEKQGLNEDEQKVVLACKKLVEQAKQSIIERKMTPQELAVLAGAIKGELKSEDGKTFADQFNELKELAKKQGTTLQELGLKIGGNEAGNKSIGQVLEEAKEDLLKVYQNGSGAKTFMIRVNEKGHFVMSPFDVTKAAGPHGTIANTGGTTQAASIAQSIDAASLLRLGGDAPIISQYRNTPWVFELANMINAGYEMPLAMWFEEQAKAGGSSTVVEGATKPKTQYSYELKSATYKKEATLIGFSEEFSLDFGRLQSDILGKGRVDLINNINSTVLTNILSAATAYNTASSFTGGTPLISANDYQVIAAMAAQVDNATFGANANAAVMSTFKKYVLGTAQDSQGRWIDRPSVLAPLSFVGNPGMSADDILVGDLKQYNVILRGGLIVRVGYNGTDFANNMFSVVMEQFYFDYISSIRAAAIVKGQTFGAVRTALTT